jgi:acyl-CoA synthetase (AMP-forming)/AMP-acid ligase II
MMMGLRDFTIYDFISRNSLLYPERDAIVFGDTRLNHGQFKKKCDYLAAGLVKSGIQKGDRVAIIAHNSDQFLILYGAAAKIGAIVLPVNWRFQNDEIAYVLKDCTPKMVFAGADDQERVADVARNLPFVQKLYGIGSDANYEAYEPFETLYVEDGADKDFDVAAEAGYVIIHTAAVEGTPRGALLSQANIIAVNAQQMAVNRLDEDASYLCVLPLYHIAALSMVMSVMHRGGKNVILDRFDPGLALDCMEKENVTAYGSFAPMLKMLLDKSKERSHDLSSLRSIGGLEDPESISSFLKMAPKAAFYSAYGQTEAMAVTGCNAVERPGSAGKPSILTRVALFDDYDREVPTGEPGEICVRSPAVFLGYWGLEEETAYTFRNGWHHTGDIGRFDAGGYLWYVKRKAQKELIKPGGENVYPAEVEKTILGHGGIAEVCVIGVPDDAWGEAIKAVCVLKGSAAVQPQDLIDHVAAKIARYKKPKYVVFVESLPKTKEGDIDRAQIKRDHGGKY